MKLINLLDFQDSHRLTRVVWLTFAALIVVAVSFAGYYYWDRYVHLGDVSPIELGVGQLEEAVIENPQDPESRAALAQYYLQNGSYVNAIDQAQQILAAYPDNDNALFILGISYVKSGEIETAVQPLESFVAIRRQSSMAKMDTVLETALYFLGESYVQLQKPTKAIPILSEALEINASDADAMYQLGLAYAQNGQHELAIKQYANAVRFVPDFTESYHGMIESYTALSQPSYVAYARGMEAFSMQDYGVAFTHLESAVKALPDFAPAHLGLGLVQEQMGDLAAAQSSLERALELDPDNFLANHALGRIQLKLSENL